MTAAVISAVAFTPIALWHSWRPGGGVRPTTLALPLLALVGKILVLAVIGAIALVAVVVWARLKIL